ncbi:RNA-splicing factor [Dimargaris verticillata]|uniref:Pre-mRNA-splicing factor CWC24 n=1 Tax=Dimargaris verticillata TaxID=2761393 RepID=A0A9W8B6B3_9FUNG|nr:RNA-splicing factor [Dimargaris verticillata]
MGNPRLTPTTRSPPATATDPPAAPTPALYEGSKNYKIYTTPRESASGSKRKAGPIRAPSNIRVTSRFDYQPDICKDYKETGFCGYGDSCKFMHDRSDYKSGWQLEREWEEKQKQSKRDYDLGSLSADEASEDDDDDGLPFACLICRKPFTRPVVTKCSHYFCEKCALQQYKKSPKCYACNTPTGGIFNSASAMFKKSAQKQAKKPKRPRPATDEFTIEGLTDL